MVDIRPNQLPDAILPLRDTDELVVDQGADGVRKAPPSEAVNSVAPVASQSEAVAGADNTKRMTPLRTKQSIASEVGVTLASNTQGAKADSAVQSVNGKTGNSVTLVKGDVGLGNVDNTSDLDKPISTATQAALNAKANSSVTISAGVGLDGGGNLTANRTVSLNAASIASLAKADSAVQTVNGVSPTGGNVTVSAEEKRLQDTRTTAMAESFGSNVLFVETAGYSSVGDGGGALYKRVSSEPSHAGKFQSADGAWWELVGLEINARQLGAKGDGVNDDTTVLQNFLDCTVSLRVNGRIPSGTWNISAPGLLLDHSSVAGDFTPSIYGEGPLTLFVCAAGNYIAFETRGYNSPSYGAKLQTVGGFTIYKPSGLDGIGFKSTGFCFGRYERIRTIGFNIGQSYEGAFSCEIEQPYSYSNNVGMDFIPGTGDTGDPGGGLYCPNAITITQPYISTNNVQGIHVLRPANFAVRGGSIENNGVQETNSVGLWAENPGYQGRQGIILDGVYFEDNAGRADVLITSNEGPSVNTIKDCNFARISSTKYTTNNILTDVTVDMILLIEGNGFGGAGDYVSDVSRPYVAFTSQAPIYRGFDTNLFVQDVGARYLKRPQFTAVGDAASVVINTNQQVLAFPALSGSSLDYSSANNRFVAPFDGLYQFTATLGLNSVTTEGSIGFAKNGTLLTEAIVRFTGVQPVSITRAISLVEGDYVDVRALMDSGWSFDYRGFISSFSGFLVS